MANLIYPRLLLPPGRISVSKMVRRKFGPTSADDFAQEQSGASGRWKIALSDLPVWSADQIKVWRAIDARLARGYTMSVPIYDERQIGALMEQAALSFSDGSWFSDGSGFGWDEINVIAAAAAVLRAPQISLQVMNGPALTGGEYFSVTHPAAGDRLYLIDGILSDPGDGTYSVSIWPNLREALAGGETLSFSHPVCTCRLTSDSRMDDERVKEILTRRSATFVEAYA